MRSRQAGPVLQVASCNFDSTNIQMHRCRRACTALSEAVCFCRSAQAEDGSMRPSTVFVYLNGGVLRC